MDDIILPNYLEFVVERREYNYEFFTESVGSWFFYGTLGGSFCHFFKGLARGQSFGAGINAMRVNSLRTGGFFACFSLAIDIPSYLLYQYRGGKVVWSDRPISRATGGAIMWAPRGLRSASLAALTCGGIDIVNLGIKIALKNFRFKYDNTE